MPPYYSSRKITLKIIAPWQYHLICSKKCEMNNFLAILELCVFYIEYKKVKFITINFCGRANAKYFIQTHVLWFYKDTAKVSSLPLLKITTKSTHFLPAKKKTQKQPSRGVLRKRCSENMLQIYRRTPMPDVNFNKFAKKRYWNHTSACVFSCKFGAYFQNTYS